MFEQETIEPEYEEIKKEHEIQIDDNKLRIEMNENRITFILMIGITDYKYTKEYIVFQ